MTWISRPAPETAEAIRALAGRAAELDGVAPLSGHVLEGLAGTEDSYILATLGTDLIGLAVSHSDDPVELFVDPAHRREGLGTELLRTALARTGAVWAHGDLTAAAALAAKLGLAQVRRLVQMRRPIDPAWAAEQVAGAVIPDGVRLRTFVPGQDEAQFLGVNARAFSWHPEQGRLDLAGLRAEMAQPWFDPLGFFLAVDEHDTVLGFHWTKVHSTGPTPMGEVYVLGVDPAGSLHGRPLRGLGAPLTAIGLDHLASAGLHTVLLYVEGDNDRALRLYRGLGFETFATDVVYRTGR